MEKSDVGYKIDESPSTRRSPTTVGRTIVGDGGRKTVVGRRPGSERPLFGDGGRKDHSWRRRSEGP
ncbi:hypothetical protein KFK09_004446 [Dendrobium nobile]|uniref:Uncharacterized protein n=1 Tax=Dendrobium nobile TaxID=94219 RepID=A0A8T3C0H2_DENNO|nr:hypothetical protein KFK09_004446 [Dendrobium nobile]